MNPFERPREHLPLIFNERGLLHCGVEVGVCRGGFSKTILESWPGILHLIDPWCDQIEYEESQPHEANYNAMLESIRPYANRVCICRKTSLEAATAFEDSSLDFCYLDANHAYRAVRADLEAWYPKVRVGGIMAGDDYGPSPIQPVDFGDGIKRFGVKAAVDEFALKVGRNVSIDLLANWDVGGFRARGFWWIK